MNKADLLKEIRERYDTGWSADIHNREEMESDLRYVAGEQWPEDVRLERESDERPCVVENRLPQFVRQVANDMRSNPPAVKVLPGSGGADKAVADILTGMVRDIEARSSTKRPYVSAGASAARCGIGYWRVVTDYESPTSFEQVINLDVIPNPFAVVWDPTSVTVTREDANWCFVLEEIPEDEFPLMYPKAQPISFDGKDHDAWSSGWMNGDKKTIRVAEYWRKVKEPAKVCLLANGQSGFKDDLPEGIPPEMIVAERESDRVRVEMIKTNGFEILEEAQEWPTPHIPIVPVVGEEFSVGDMRLRHSVIRFAKEPQQLYNYWLSTQTEHLALQPKAPYVATAAQVEGYEDVWKTANTTNHSVLVYNVDPTAPNSRPQREQPPASSSAFTEQVLRAGDAMKATTGIYDAGLGAQGNETSGKAIQARDRQGDVSTFEFRDNLNASVEYTGRILVDLIPVIYDTPRMIRVLGEDGEENFAEINKPVMGEDGSQIIENDLRVGQYNVHIKTGPSFTTRRQEAAESMLQFIQTSPQSAQIVMDLIAKNMDWPGADEFSERFKKMLPPEVRLETDDPEEQQKLAQQAEQDQQAQEMQARGAMAEIAEKEGKAAESQADAQKAAIEAQKMQLEMMLESGALNDMISQQVQAQVTQALQMIVAQDYPQ